MNRIQYIIFLLCLFSLNIQAQVPSYQVSILTCDRGDQLYTTFGHSALRLLNRDTGRDLVFNYGTFDFKTENFYTKFMRGQLPYYLSMASTARFLYIYELEQRTVREQILDLDDTEVRSLLRFLEHNVLPENREYAYDFFFDNCSTRLYDLLNTIVQDTIAYGIAPQENLSYRNLLDEHLVYMPWSDFGIDLVIGAIADREATISGQMYIPSYLQYYLSQARAGDSLLVAQDTVLLDFEKEAALRNTYFFLTPVRLFWIIFGLGICLLFLALTRNKPLGFKMYALSMSALAGVIGVVIVFLWFFTNHMATGDNYNLLWINPLYLLLIPSIMHVRRQRLYQYLRLLLAGTCIVCLIGWSWIPQQFHQAFIPWILSLLLLLLYPWISSWWQSRKIASK